MVKSPVVLMLILPVELMPLYVIPPAITVPIVRLPVFTMVSAPNPLPVAMLRIALLVLLSVIALSPIRAKPWVLDVIAPEIVIAPVELPILEMLPKVTAPAYVAAVALELVKAPAASTPAPFRVKASAPLTFSPLRSSVAPLATVVPDATVPNALAWPSLRVPDVTVVVPE